MPRPSEYVGSRLRIECFVLDDGSCPAGDFLDRLPKKERRKLDILFEMLGESGKISNPEKFRKLVGTDGLFEFKCFQIRIFCCYGKDKLVLLLYGLIKKQDKQAKTDIQRAAAYKRQFESRTGGDI